MAPPSGPIRVHVRRSEHDTRSVRRGNHHDTSRRWGHPLPPGADLVAIRVQREGVCLGSDLADDGPDPIPVVRECVPGRPAPGRGVSHSGPRLRGQVFDPSIGSTSEPRTLATAFRLDSFVSRPPHTSPIEQARRSATRSRCHTEGSGARLALISRPSLIEQGRNDRDEIQLPHRRSRRPHRSSTTFFVDRAREERPRRGPVTSRPGCTSRTSATAGGSPRPPPIEQGRNDRVEIPSGHRPSPAPISVQQLLIEHAAKERVEILLPHRRSRLAHCSTTAPSADRAREERPRRDPVTSRPGCTSRTSANTTGPPHPPPVEQATKERDETLRTHDAASTLSALNHYPPPPIEQGRNDRVEILLPHRRSRRGLRTDTAPFAGRAREERPRRDPLAHRRSRLPHCSTTAPSADRTSDEGTRQDTANSRRGLDSFRSQPLPPLRRSSKGGTTASRSRHVRAGCALATSAPSAGSIQIVTRSVVSQALPEA